MKAKKRVCRKAEEKIRGGEMNDKAERADKRAGRVVWDRGLRWGPGRQKGELRVDTGGKAMVERRLERQREEG